MARLPTVGGDYGNWGTVLNEYLGTAHNADGTLKLDVQTIADLKAIDVATLTDKQQALVAGYYAPGDGGGGVFYYDAAASTADNGGTIFAPPVGAGRWLRIYSGAVNVKWFGAKGDGVTDDTEAFSAALGSSAPEIIIPAGTFSVITVVVNRNVSIVGAGRRHTILSVTGHGNYADLAYGVLFRGAVSGRSLSDIARVSDITFVFASTELGQHGLVVTRKLVANGIRVEGAPGDGMHLRSVSPSAESPYFSQFTDCVFKSNGANGVSLTDNVNACIFVNCQFTSNGMNGFHQALKGYSGQNQAVYNTVFVNGQASYNQVNGIYFQHGSNCHVYGTYAEFNSAADGDPKNGAGKNLRLGSSVTRMNCMLGEVGTDVDPHLTVAVESWNLANRVAIGGGQLTPFENISIGRENTGNGRTLVFNGAINCEHILLFKETTNDRIRFRYDGSADNLHIEAWTAGSQWLTVMTVNRSGNMSFFGAPTVGRPTVSGSTGGNAALQSLVAALASLGVITDSTT